MNIAKQLITMWYECAKNKYDDSVVGKLEYDELEIENDLVQHLSSAIESLINDKSKERKSTPGWSFGFICGHVQGALNVKWSNKYLVESSKEFEDLMKLKTILELLRIDSDISQKIEIIYNYFTAHRNEVVDKEEALPENVISLAQSDRKKNENKERCRKKFDEYFEKLFMANYMSLLQTYETMCCPDLTEYLDECEIINLVGKEHFA